MSEFLLEEKRLVTVVRVEGEVIRSLPRLWQSLSSPTPYINLIFQCQEHEVERKKQAM